MSVQRVPSAPFAQIANEALRDSRLSFKARGLLAMVLSHSGEWVATRRWLEAQSQHDGRAAVQSALDELTQFGYRSVTYERVGAEIRTVVVWRHSPEVLIFCPTENLSDRQPDGQETGRALEDNSSEHHLEEHSEDITGCLDNFESFDERQTLSLIDAGGVDFPAPNAISLSDDTQRRGNQGNVVRSRDIDTFDVFWSIYPRKAAKGAALKAWGKATKRATADEIIRAAAQYRDDPNRDDQFTKHPTTWLNGDCWTDEALPAKSRRVTGGDARMDNYEALYHRFTDRREIAQ